MKICGGYTVKIFKSPIGQYFEIKFLSKTNYLAPCQEINMEIIHQVASDHIKAGDVWGEWVINTKQVTPLLLLPFFARSPHSELLKD